MTSRPGNCVCLRFLDGLEGGRTRARHRHSSRIDRAGPRHLPISQPVYGDAIDRSRSSIARFELSDEHSCLPRPVAKHTTSGRRTISPGNDIPANVCNESKTALKRMARMGGKLTLGERAFQWEGTLAFRSLGGAHSWPNFPSRLSAYSQMVNIDHQSRARRVFVTSRLAPELTTCVDVAALVSHAC